MTRRTVMMMVVGALVLAVGAGTPGWAQKPIKIGFLAHLTGGGAAVGMDMVDVFKMLFDDNNNQLCCRKVDLIIEDSQRRSEVALNKLRKFIESDHAYIVGV